MEITSKGLQSEFIFHAFEGIVTDLGDCIMARTPSNPDYYFGNFLLFGGPPQADQIAGWITRFEQEFAPYSEVRHRTFQWLPSSPVSDEVIAEFKQAGFTLDETQVLAGQAVHLDKPAPEGVEFRKLKTDEEWKTALDSQARNVYPGATPEDYRRYKEACFDHHRRMADAGFGDWWGAFKGDELVANMGLYFGDGVGRFQAVETSPEHRRQGICRAMVHHVSNDAFAKHPGITLILHADAHEVARHIYKSVGYEQIELLQSFHRAPLAK